MGIAGVPLIGTYSNESMTRLLLILAAAVGGYAGWALGAVVGTFTAFTVSMVGTGVGLYFAHRVTEHYRP